MSNKKTHEDIEKELTDILKDDYIIINKYEGGDKPIIFQHKCNRCKNFIFKYKTASPILSKINKNIINHENFCPICSGRIRNRDNNIVDLLIYSRVEDEYTRLSDYGGSNKDKILMRHNCEKCDNFIWAVSLNHFLKNKNPVRCPKCSGVYHKTTEDFKEEIFIKFGNEYTVLGEYTNNKDKILMRHNCEKCNNYEYEVRPNDILNNHLCPECNRKNLESKAVKYIKNYFNKYNIMYEDEKIYEEMKFINTLRIDFLVKGIHIEYDGSFHWYDFYNESPDIQQTRDSVKNDYCLNNNLTLIRIPYIEEANLEEILDAIINYNEEILIRHNCLIIRDGNLINQPDIYSWYNINSVILNEENKE